MSAKNTMKTPIKSEKKMLYYLWMLLPIIFFSFTTQVTANQPGTVVQLTADEHTWLKAHPQITMAIPINNPRSYHGSNGKLQGMDVDYIHLLEQRLGVQFEYKVSNWDTALDRAMKHEVDTILNAAKVKNREPYLHFTEIYSTTPQAVIALENEPTLSDFSDFCGRKIAVHKGSSRVAFLKENYPCIELIEVTDKKDILSAVITRKADAGFDNFDSIVGNQKEMLLPYLKIIYFEYLPPVGFARIGVRKDAPLLVSILNKVILSITEEEKSHIVLKWLGVKLPPLPGTTEQTAIVDLTESEKSWLNTHPVIRIAYNTQLAPIEYQDEDGKLQGISSSYLARLELDTGIRFKKVPVRTLEDIESLLAQNKLDMMAILSETAQRQIFHSFSAPYLSIPTAIFSTSDVVYLGGIEALKEKRIATIGDYALYKWLQKEHPQLDLIPVQDIKEGLRLLSRGEVFAFVGDLLTTSHYIAKQGLTQLKVVGEIPYRYQLSMAVRKDLPILATIIDKALDNISQQERDAIYNEWVSIQYSHQMNYTLIWILLTGGIVLFSVILFWNRKMASEISNRKRIEEQLRKLSRAVEQSHSTIVITDLDANIEFVNPAFTKSTGYTLDEVLHQNLRILKSGEHDASFYQSMWDTLTRDEVWQGEIYNKHKSGSCYWESVTISPVKDESGKTTHYVAVKEDISDRKAAEKEKEKLTAQLHQAQKLESIGLMAGGVAHDLNNILAGIVGYPELMLHKLPEGSELIKPIKAIHESGNRAAVIVADLLTVARGAASVRGNHDLNILIQEYLDSPEYEELKSQHPGISFQRQFTATEHQLLCSPVHIKKCLMNLIINAAESISGAGEVTISTCNTQITASSNMHHDLEEGSYIVLSIKDTGTGISSKDIAHIFEPFYTKKLMGRSGTGLGLTVVWNTMEDHNGKVLVESDDNGTSFQLYFPMSEEKVTEQVKNNVTENLAGSNEHILVVDDEPQLRDLASQILQSMSYKVDSVCSGELAVKFVKENSVDLIVIDMMMEPGMNGYQTYKEILKLNPNQKAVIASGFSENNDIKAALELGAGGFIKKPYSMMKLGQAVKEALSVK